MLRRRLYVKINRKANRLYSLVLLMMIFLFNGCSATHRGDLTFNDPQSNTFNISGKIVLNDIVETDSARTSLATISDFTYFKVTAGDISTQADKNGNFSLKGIPFSDSIVVKAVANKIGLLCRVTADEICYSDLSSLEINLDTTSEALVYQQGLLLKKNLTPADIKAREYEAGLSEVKTAVKLAMQLPKQSIKTTELDIDAVVSAAKKVAQNCTERNSVLKDANTVLKNAFLRKDLGLIKLYLSPSFGNDWDSSSSWSDAIGYFEEMFNKGYFKKFTWDIQDIELLENNKARIRTKVSAILMNKNDEVTLDRTWEFDAMWRLEGTLWKLYRNMPYREKHPTQADADSRWGEIAAVFVELQNAVEKENITTISNRVSEAFRNEFDGNSTKSDLILTATSRFNKMDVKVSEYTIDSVQFTTADEAKVTCHGHIKVINIIQGVDIDSGEVQAMITFHKEDGIWRIYRDMPYRFTHPTTLQ